MPFTFLSSSAFRNGRAWIIRSDNPGPMPGIFSNSSFDAVLTSSFAVAAERTGADGEKPGVGTVFRASGVGVVVIAFGNGGIGVDAVRGAGVATGATVAAGSGAARAVPVFTFHPPRLA